MASDREEIESVKKRVDAYLAMGRLDSAEKLLKSALADFGTAANLLNLLGLVYHKQSRLPEAVSYFRKSTEANPEFVEATLNLAATLCDLSEYDEAQQVFKTLKELGPSRHQIPKLILGRIASQHANCGKLYEESGLHYEAIVEYKKATSLYPKMPDVKLALARLYLLTGKLEESKLELEDVVRIDPNFPAARVWLGVVYYKLGQLDLAKQQWNIANKYSPYDAYAKAYARISTQWAASDS